MVIRVIFNFRLLGADAAQQLLNVTNVAGNSSAARLYIHQDDLRDSGFFDGWDEDASYQNNRSPMIPSPLSRWNDECRILTPDSVHCLLIGLKREILSELEIHRAKDFEARKAKREEMAEVERKERERIDKERREKREKEKSEKNARRNNKDGSSSGAGGSGAESGGAGIPSTPADEGGSASAAVFNTMVEQIWSSALEMAEQAQQRRQQQQQQQEDQEMNEIPDANSNNSVAAGIYLQLKKFFMMTAFLFCQCCFRVIREN